MRATARKIRPDATDILARKRGGSAVSLTRLYDAMAQVMGHLRTLLLGGEFSAEWIVTGCRRRSRSRWSMMILHGQGRAARRKQSYCW